MAFTSVSMSSFDAKLKQWYIDRKKLYLMDSYKVPLYNAITKKTDAGGKGWNVAVGAASIVGGGGTYANSWANASAGSDVNFNGAWKDRFGHGFIDDKLIRASKNADGGVEPALEGKIAQVRDQFLQGTEYELFRNENGAIAELASFTLDAGGYITGTLSTNTAPSGLQRLRPNMQINFSANSDMTSPRGSGAAYKVTKVGNATFVCTGSAGAVTPGSTDYLCIDGSGNGKALCGLDSWCPKTETLAATTFKAVDRSSDTRALAGIRLAADGLSFTEAFIQAGDLGARYGAESAIVFVHPTNYSALKQETQGKAIYDNRMGSPGVAGGTKGMSKGDAAKFGFRALVLDGSSRPVLVVPSWACPLDSSYAVELDSFWLETMGPWPSLKDLDGVTKMLRLTDGVNNSYVHELVGYGEALCSAPGHQVVIVHSTAA